jgi:hypothetical protein
VNVKACGTYRYQWALKDKKYELQPDRTKMTCDTSHLPQLRSVFQKLLRMMFRVFWDVVSCSHVEVDWCYRGAYCLHFALMMEAARTSVNISQLQCDYTALHPRRRRENLKCHMLYIILWKGYIYTFDFLILKPTKYVELDPEGSSPYSRAPATGSYPEPVGSTSHTPSQSP